MAFNLISTRSVTFLVVLLATTAASAFLGCGKDTGRVSFRGVVKYLEAGDLTAGSTLPSPSFPSPWVSDFRVDPVDDRYYGTHKLLEGDEAVMFYTIDGKMYAACHISPSGELWYFCDIELFRQHVELNMFRR